LSPSKISLIAYYFVFIIHGNSIFFLSSGLPLGKHTVLVQNGSHGTSLIGAWALLNGKNTKIAEYPQCTCCYMFTAFWLFWETFGRWFAARD
jgi:hypothetical protein